MSDKPLVPYMGVKPGPTPIKLTDKGKPGPFSSRSLTIRFAVYVLSVVALLIGVSVLLMVAIANKRAGH